MGASQLAGPQVDWIELFIDTILRLASAAPDGAGSMPFS